MEQHLANDYYLASVATVQFQKDELSHSTPHPVSRKMTGCDELCEQLSLCGHNSTVACPFLRHGRRTTEPRCAGRTALLDRMGGRLRRLPVRLTTAWVQALRARASLWHRTRPCCAQAATLQPSPAALHLRIPRDPPDPSNIHFRTTNRNNPSTTAAATTTTATRLPTTAAAAATTAVATTTTIRPPPVHAQRRSRPISRSNVGPPDRLAGRRLSGHW